MVDKQEHHGISMRPSTARRSAAGRPERGSNVTKVKKLSTKVEADRRAADRRKTVSERRSATVAVAVDGERRVIERREKVNRRRQIDPTTCERDYTDAEVEFMHALDQYKRSSGRMFPTCSEVLEVLRGLGYEKLSRTAPVQVIEQTAV
jgi:hypothetical protein